MDNRNQNQNYQHPENRRKISMNVKKEMLADYEKIISADKVDEKLTVPITKNLHKNARHELKMLEWVDARMKKRDDQIRTLIESAKSLKTAVHIDYVAKKFSAIESAYIKLELSYQTKFKVEKNSFIAKHIPRKWPSGTEHYETGSLVRGVALAERGVQSNKSQLDELLHECSDYIAVAQGHHLANESSNKRDSKEYGSTKKIKEHFASKSQPVTPEESPSSRLDRQVRRTQSLKDEAEKTKAALWAELLASQSDEFTSNVKKTSDELEVELAQQVNRDAPGVNK